MSDQVEVFSEEFINLKIKSKLTLQINMNDGFKYTRNHDFLEIISGEKIFVLGLNFIFKYIDNETEINLRISKDELPNYVKMFNLIENKVLTYKEELEIDNVHNVYQSDNDFNFDNYNLTEKALRLIDEYVAFLSEYSKKRLIKIMKRLHEKTEELNIYDNQEIIQMIIIKILDKLDLDGYTILYSDLKNKFSKYI